MYWEEVVKEMRGKDIIEQCIGTKMQGHCVLFPWLSWEQTSWEHNPKASNIHSF